MDLDGAFRRHVDRQFMDDQRVTEIVRNIGKYIFMSSSEQKPLREQLKAALVQAMKARQNNVVRTLRSILSEIDNAEAVDVTISSVPVVGLSKDVPRKILSEEQMQDILQNQYDEIQISFTEYKRLGKDQEAKQLQMELEVLAPYLKDTGK
jgi:uncharacterized protein